MFSAELEVIMEEAELGEEYLIRVRVVEVSEDTIEVTRLGDTEPRVLTGRRSCKLMPLAVRNTGTRPE